MFNKEMRINNGFNFIIPLMNWFPAVFMIKIIIGFAVQRTKLSII